MKFAIVSCVAKCTGAIGIPVSVSAELRFLYYTMYFLALRIFLTTAQQCAVVGDVL